MKFEKIQVHRFSSQDWPGEVSDKIHTQVLNILALQKSCTIFLTGGRTAKKVYQSWREISNFSSLKNINFFLGDERCVDVNHKDSNYKMVLDSLFKRGIPKECYFSQLYDGDIESNQIIKKMSSQYPNSPDLLLLSLGEDGHIASLFPGTKEINKKTNIDLILKKKGHNRLTITPKVIEVSKNKIVFVQGMKKIDKFNEILSSNKNILAYPAHLLEDASWFLID